MRALPTRPLLLLLAGLAACSGQQGCGGCAGFTATPQGTFSGTKMDSSGAVRVSGSGYATLNTLTPQLLASLAPDGGMDVPVDCSIQSTAVGTLAMGDQGGVGCTSEACGQLDGKCDAKDVPQQVHITISSLQLAPGAPDLVQAVIKARVQTGKLMLSSVNRNLPLCLILGGGALKCGVDLDTTRAGLPDNELDIGIQLTIDPRWDKLLSLKVTDVQGTKACGTSGALPSPRCMDQADLDITKEGSCSACSGANVSFVKQMLLDELGKSLKQQLDDSIKQSNCLSCTGGGPACPSSVTATSTCDATRDGGSGTCMDPGTGACVPAMMGTEGVIDVGAQLTSAGAPPEAQLALMLAAGGGATSNSTGTTVGLRGGFKAVTVPLCVAPLSRPAPLGLPLPDLDLDAPGPYDLAFSLSQQYLDEAFFQLQQSGALCLAVGHDSVAQLESSALATLLPSLGKLTGGASVPLRIVVRPMNPPTATVGAGTVDSHGKPLDPLIRFDWKGVALDMYALLDDRYMRLLSLGADLSLPIGLTTDGCSTLTPTVGSLSQAVTNVTVSDSELLAENLDVLKALVPTLIASAEGSISNGLPPMTLPPVQGFQVKLAGAKGVGQVTGTTRYNHLGIYAQLLPPTPACVPSPRPQPPLRQKTSRRGAVELETTPNARLLVRVDGGFWRTAQSDAVGTLTVEHPVLRLAASHVVEVREEGGRSARVVVDLR